MPWDSPGRIGVCLSVRQREAQVLKEAGEGRAGSRGPERRIGGPTAPTPRHSNSQHRPTSKTQPDTQGAFNSPTGSCPIP